MTTIVRLALLMLPAALTGCGWQSFTSGSPRICQNPSQADGLSEQLFRLVNMERVNQNPSLGQLAWDDDLAKIAGDYACRMIEGEFFGHVDPDSKSKPHQRLTTAGYEYHIMGENLAVGQYTAAEVFDRWMRSPPHRANLVATEWKRAGIGVRAADDGTIYWVLELADPAP